LLGDVQEFWYSHEGVVFLSSLVLLVVAQQAFGVARWQRVFGLAVLPVTIFAMMATERRAGQIGLMVAFIAAALVFMFAHRKAFFLMAVPTLVIGAVYLPIFWNSSGVMAQPARAVRSLVAPDPRDAQSNLTRDLEKINVYATIRAYPILGVGFGRAFLQIVSLPDISFFPLCAHEPHHNIMWIWLKTGALGFIFFWTILGTALAQAARYARTLREPELRVFALLTICGIISAVVFSYVDLGLTSGRITVFLGTLLGTLSVLGRLREEDVTQLGAGSAATRIRVTDEAGSVTTTSLPPTVTVPRSRIADGSSTP
jgi:hypothetical protein